MRVFIGFPGVMVCLAILIFLSFQPSSAENPNPTVNILLVYDNPSILEGFESTINVLRESSLNITIGKVYKMLSNSSGLEIGQLINSLCRAMDNITSNEATKPDIVIDLTHSGVASEAIKTIIKVMNLPTVSGSFGLQGSIRTWRELPEKMRHYIIHIAPPAQILPQAVRSIVEMQDMDNAAVLYDQKDYVTPESCIRWNHNKKPIINDISAKPDFQSLFDYIIPFHDQISWYVFKNFTNFFVVSSPSEISRVLGAAARQYDSYRILTPFTTNEYAWFSMSLHPDLPNCSKCESNVTLIHLGPKLKNKIMNMTVTEMFQFDLTSNAILTVGKMKREGTWKNPPHRVCKDSDLVQDDYELDFYNNFNSEEIYRDNLLEPFHMDENMAIGKSHANFELDINLLQYQVNGTEPESNIFIGTWKAGVGGMELIMSEDYEDEWIGHRSAAQ